MPTVLTKDDIKYHEESSDRDVFLFWYQNRLFRSHIPEVEEIFNKVKNINHALIQEISETEFVLDMTDFGYANITVPVYEHKVYHHRVRIQELPNTKIKSFIAKICRLNSDLIAQGFIIKDIHESNALETIDGFKWVDLGAIANCNISNSVTSFVLVSYLIRKYLLKSIQCNAYDTCLDDVKNSKDIMSTFADQDFTKSTTWLDIANAVEGITVSVQTSHWSENYSNIMDINNPSLIGPKAVSINSIIEEIEYETVTDVACNKGYYSFLAAKRAKSVIGFDYVPACIDIAYTFNEQFKLPTVFAVKTVESIRSNSLFETIRYKSDLVMALAIVHHIKNVVSPLEFVEMLLSISNKYILIEDIDQKDHYEKCFIDNNCELVKRIDSSPLPRTLSLYRKL